MNTQKDNGIILFKKTIFDKNNNIYEVGCGPWIYATRFLIFCEFNENIPKGEYIIEFNETNDILIYNIYEMHFSSIPYIITKLDSDQIDLYSDVQTIKFITL